MHPLIVQYTAGPINPDQSIRIRFLKALQSDQITSAIHTTGNTSFNAMILDSMEIQVSPDPSWPKGGTVSLQINMKELFGNTLSGPDRALLDFNVKEQHVSVISNGLSIPEVQVPDQMAVSGSIQLAIPESGTAVEGLISAKQ